MKIRKGFVSNSSTTSFCIYGAIVEEQKLIRAVNKAFSEKCYGGYEAGEILKDKGYATESNYDGDEFYVGRYWKSVKDKETGKEFKESVEKLLVELLGKKVSCGTHEEAWRDG